MRKFFFPPFIILLGPTSFFAGQLACYSKFPRIVFPLPAREPDQSGCHNQLHPRQKPPYYISTTSVQQILRVRMASAYVRMLHKARKRLGTAWCSVGVGHKPMLPGYPYPGGGKCDLCLFSPLPIFGISRIVVHPDMAKVNNNLQERVLGTQSMKFAGDAIVSWK
ncbi:hypothetical protein F4809DRAFT_635278 [Biscogniauxia mediterranea]|nr:hypothetical protein F4809DRAFT_635278 [Biscogniauxia mediterranea]